MHTVRVHPLIVSGDQWVGYAHRPKNGELELYPSIEHVGEKLRPITLEKLIEADRTLAQLENLPPLTQACAGNRVRSFPGAAFPSAGPISSAAKGRLGRTIPIGSALALRWSTSGSALNPGQRPWKSSRKN